MGNLLRKIGGGLFQLLLPNTSEFWTGTVNAALQVILRLLPPDLAGHMAKPLADLLATLFPYAAGRIVSKIAKG